MKSLRRCSKKSSTAPCATALERVCSIRTKPSPEGTAMDEFRTTYGIWLWRVVHFRSGFFGWLLSILTVIVIGPFVYFGMVLIPEGPYPSVIIAFPGLFLTAVLFFALSPICYRLDHPRRHGPVQPKKEPRARTRRRSTNRPPRASHG
jgi:hypothetical protein